MFNKDGSFTLDEEDPLVSSGNPYSEKERKRIERKLKELERKKSKKRK